MPWEPELTDAELVLKILEIAKKQPYLSEAGVCGKMGFDRDYINDRSKKSPDVLRAKNILKSLRQTAWEEKGFAGLTAKTFNATTYVWMTRNMIGWRDKTEDTPNTVIVNNNAEPVEKISKQDMLELIQKAKEQIRNTKDGKNGPNESKRSSKETPKE